MTVKLSSLFLSVAFLFGLASCSPNKVIDYADLSFEAGQPLHYPEDAGNASHSLPPFSQKDVIKDSDYIAECRIVKSEIVDCSDNTDAIAYSVLYTAEPTVVFYAKDNSLKVGEKIVLETPLPDRLVSAAVNASSESVRMTSTPTAEMLTNRSYIICLKQGEEGVAYCLTAPYYRPVEITADGHYVFYEGWKSLLKHSFDVKIEETISEYKYREDDGFITDWKALIKKYK